jgi:hypothetical protein
MTEIAILILNTYKNIIKKKKDIESYMNNIIKLSKLIDKIEKSTSFFKYHEDNEMDIDIKKLNKFKPCSKLDMIEFSYDEKLKEDFLLYDFLNDKEKVSKIISTSILTLLCLNYLDEEELFDKYNEIISLSSKFDPKNPDILYIEGNI